MYFGMKSYLKSNYNHAESTYDRAGFGYMAAVCYPFL